MYETKDKIVISIDCMGGDLGEQEVLKGIVEAYNQNNYQYFIIHGTGNLLPKLLRKNKILSGAFKYVEANKVVTFKAYLRRTNTGLTIRLAARKDKKET